MTKDVVAERLDEAGVGSDRLVDVKNGEKACFDHTHRSPDEIAGNYGVHARADDTLVLVDIDDYEDIEDRSGLTALAELPPTFEEESPHGGTHRFYTVPPTEDGRFVAKVFEDEFGAQNPIPSWGEARVANEYVVAAGSQLDGCGKDDCDDCETEQGGQYVVKNDREIAEVDADTLVEVLSEDPKIEREDTKVTEFDGEVTSQTEDGEKPEAGSILSYALTDSGDEKLKRLWRGDYSDYGGDRSEAESALAYKLAFWVGHGRGTSSTKRIVRDAMNGTLSLDSDAPRPSLQKWEERGENYRDSVLEAVDECAEFFEPGSRSGGRSAPSYDEDEVARGGEILQAESTPTSPAGEMAHENGHYGYWEERRDDSGEVVGRDWKQVTNFTLETLEVLNTDEGDLLKLRVHPAHPHEDEYEVAVHPTVFNETRAFKEEIVRGKTTRYEPGKYSQTALNDLRETVGSQLVPNRKGVEHIGLAGEDYEEWITPKGTMSAEGPAEDPEHRYYAKGGSSDSDGGALARKWNLDPQDASEYDSDAVAKIVELLPKTRRHDRGLPILGWFYAAPLRPLVHDWEGEFNLLQVVGSTGTGKTSTLKAFWEALGMDPDPFSASATPFTLMKHMSSSSGIPVWIDEYKPADIRNDRLDTLHRRLRETTKGGSVSKGRANLGETLFTLKAPVVVSGEQKFGQSVPAVRRRSIMTTLSSEPTREGTKYRRAFSELTGTPYEDESGNPQYPRGYDLSEHAAAYYRFILSRDNADLREAWNDAREETAEMLSQRGLTLQKTEFQGAQTILFGVKVFREFADHVGADPEEMPTDDEIGDAFEHYASNIGQDGKRMGYDDSFLELLAQAASNGYLDRDEDFRFMDSQKFGGEVLAFHMPSANAAVRRYVREFNLSDEYTLVGKDDYLSALRDKTERNGSHVHAVNHKVRLDGGAAKCVVIDPHRASEAIGTGFDLRSFNRPPADMSAESEEHTKAAADGGTSDPQKDAQTVTQVVEKKAGNMGRGLGRVEIMSVINDVTDRDRDGAEALLEKLKSEGYLKEHPEGGYHV